MSELGDQFLLALADQGYGLVITTEDVRILMKSKRDIWSLPLDLVEQEWMVPILMDNIKNFIEADGEFRWPPQAGAGTN